MARFFLQIAVEVEAESAAYAENEVLHFCHTDPQMVKWVAVLDGDAEAAD
jgi:hypothetical protein